MTNSCADSRFGCNCDKNDNVWREDSGLLTDKTSFQSNSAGLEILMVVLTVITPLENLSVTAQHNTNFQDCASTECRVLQLI